MVFAVSKGGDSNEGAAVNFNGNPAEKSKTGGWLAAGLILGTELAERVCVMGISMNLVTYLVGSLHISTSKSATIVTNFLGTLNLLGLLGGFLADARLGRFLSVAIFACITALGVTLLSLATTISSLRPPPCTDFRLDHQQCITPTTPQISVLFAALYTIALGAGGLKSNVSGFGSDQFDVSDPKEQTSMIFFFNRFYFCISVGSLFAVTVFVYIQDKIGRGWGYGISAFMMAMAVLVLICGARLYRYRKPKGSPLTEIFRVLVLAWEKRKLRHVNPEELNQFQRARISHTHRLRFLDKAAMDGDDESRGGSWRVSSVTQVEEVKMVIKLIPIWSTCIFFWTVYSQMTTFTIEQAAIMNRYVGSFVVPSGSFSVFLFTTILVLTSLNEKLIVPLARKITHSSKGITSLQRIGIGLAFSIAAMAAAAVVENRRRQSGIGGIRIRAFWLIPQFFLVGAGEAFAYVGQLEFFILEAPERMKSMSTGLFLSGISMGFFVSSLLVTLVEKATRGRWLMNDLNAARLNNFYWLLAAIGAVNFVVFVVLAMRHQYKVQKGGDGEGDGMEILGLDGEKEQELA